MKARRVFGLATLVYFASISFAWPTEIRDLPYPFSHVVTVASDVDLQPPWYGNAIHARMNRDLGLRIADSFWVSAALGAEQASALYQTPFERNLNASKISDHPIFWLLLREFQRGNYDHLHSWQNDGLPRYAHDLPSPLALSTESLRAELPIVQFFDWIWQSGNLQPASFRLIFDAPPPEELELALEDVAGNLIDIPNELQLRGASVQPQSSDHYIVEIPLSSEGHQGALRFRGQPRAVVLKGKSDSARLLRIEWDNFSRSIANRQEHVLRDFNIRPIMSTAHGGYTRAQNLGRPKAYAVSPFGAADMKAHVDWTARPAGDNPTSHAYHADILRRLGITSIADIPPVQYPYAIAAPNPLAALPSAPFWEVEKTWGLSMMPPVSREELEETINTLDPIAGAAGVSDYLCTKNYTCLRSEQGRTLGYQVATSLAHIRANRESVRHTWYQHFGTALTAPDGPFSLESPFAADVERTLWELSNQSYNWTGTIPQTARAWVPAPAVWQTYRITKRNLAEAINVNNATSRIDIRRVEDPVLQRPWPALQMAGRELHGLTIYVPDAEKAKVWLDGELFDSFTRNPPDSTGKPSVTLVNDAAPVTMIGPEGITGARQIGAEGADWDDTPLVFHSKSTDPVLRADLKGLSLWNVSHFRLKMLQSGPGRLWIRLTMHDGTRIALIESGSDAPMHESSIVLPERDTKAGRPLTVALSDVRPTSPILDDALPPLPLGTPVRIEIGLTGAAVGTELQLDELSALQSLPHAISPDAHVIVSGRAVKVDRTAAASQPIRLITSTGTLRETTTDNLGYYRLGNLQRGQTVTLETDFGDINGCGPIRGKKIWLMRDEVELDFEEADCR